MSERQDEVSSEIKASDALITLVADDVAVILERGMSTINFYVDTHTSRFNGKGDEVRPTGVVREHRISIKLPTTVLQGLAEGVQLNAKELKPDIDRVWIHVDRFGGRPRKFKTGETRKVNFPDLDR